MRHLKTLAATVMCVVVGLPVLLTGAAVGKAPSERTAFRADAFTAFDLSHASLVVPSAPAPTFAPVVTGDTTADLIVDVTTGPPRATSRPLVKQPVPLAHAVVKAKPRAKPKVHRQPRVGAPPTSHAVVGRASWYCSTKYPTCMHGYPPGSMVAAACGKLRAAMGPHWRGKVVAVTNRNTGVRVTVQLVDWCGSSDKLIDLYFRPMTLLGGTGVLPVVVRW